MTRSADQITRLKDRIASYFIKAGGILVLSAMMGILFFLIWVTYPLFESTTVKKSRQLANIEIESMLSDSTGSASITLDKKNGIFLMDLRKGAILSNSVNAPKLPWLSATPINSKGQTLVVDSNRTIHIGTLKILKPSGDTDMADWVIDDQWVRGPRLPEEIQKVFDFFSSLSFGLIESTNYTIAARDPRGVRFLSFTVPSESMMGEPLVPSGIEFAGNDMVRDGLFSDDGSRFFIVTEKGMLQVYSVGEMTKLLSEREFKEPLRTISFLLGGRTLLVGGENGLVSAVQWVRIKDTTNSEVYILDEYHKYPSLNGPVLGFAISPRDKRFLAWTEKDSYIVHATSEKVLPLNIKIDSGYFLPNGKGLWIQSGAELKELLISDNHPEITFSTLTKPIQYEGYGSKEYVWQSSSATDDSEPKFSLIPLVFGTLKATLYALIFAIPIAVLGAIYTSQFAGMRWRNFIKPSIEMMAALPSVVLGFIGGLILAPYFQKMSVSVFILLPIFLGILILLIPVWLMLPAAQRRRLSSGSEFLWCLPLLVAAYFISIELAPLIEMKFFSGNFVQHLLTNYDLRFDQRNSLVLGFVLGFAVIPLIYTISEDALSSVPKSLTSASLACGASPWQTAWRVVLPTASPGIFSAIMIGIGRAVGETMIVLMATGNTPIMDWSGFNGLRSLAANIAVEMPEAPVMGSHYRVLFLSALLLFVFTFILNTVAEIVSSRLRRKYESL
ncbi:MAG: hypothetical protein SGVNAXEH_000633 [Holophagaceae bacterium]|jgi:phosphate transport system permease protein